MDCACRAQDGSFGCKWHKEQKGTAAGGAAATGALSKPSNEADGAVEEEGHDSDTLGEPDIPRYGRNGWGTGS